MTTLNQLLAQKKLELFSAQLADNVQPFRLIYMTPEFEDWLNDIAFAVKEKGSPMSPSEQVEIILDEFVSGYHMGPGDLKKLTPLHQDVWEFKPPDVRVFGFFPKPGIFIAVCAEMKKKLKPNSAYKPFIQQVVTKRQSLGFTSWIKGENLNHVL